MSLARIAIFPLPSVHLFPHALLPLHIFEPRYRAMIKDCMAPGGDRQLVIAPIDETQTPSESGPHVHRVCGLGVIVEHAPLPDGRSNILVRGMGRVGIVDEHAAEMPYRTVRAESLGDRYSGAFSVDAAAHTLKLLVEQVALKLPSGGETLRELARLHDEPSALSDVLASALVTDSDARQQLMEMLDVGDRVEHVSSAMAQLLRRLSGSGGQRN
jgi:uncharacterized protein